MENQSMFQVNIIGRGRKYKYGKLRLLTEHQINQFRKWGYKVEILDPSYVSAIGASDKRAAVKAGLDDLTARIKGCRKYRDELDECRVLTADQSRLKITSDDIIDVMLALQREI
jgi:hypothetical protein